MADLPIAVNFEGDYGYKVQVFDDEDTIATVIQKATEALAGVLVAPVPAGAVLKLRLQGSEEPLPDDITVKDAGFVHMESIEIYRER